VVEIRSDGTRTIARGALEDQASGEKVALQAEGTTPLALAKELSAALFKMPGAFAGTELMKRTQKAREVATALLPRRLSQRLRRRDESR
ncbi:MAG: hypothetical protein MK135_13520, partial [Polyangiaceae bacterium]|nr:hypothetical protein [Polyangiaceae bacterium]